jgi:hypothetical protein
VAEPAAHEPAPAKLQGHCSAGMHGCPPVCHCCQPARRCQAAPEACSCCGEGADPQLSGPHHPVPQSACGPWHAQPPPAPRAPRERRCGCPDCSPEAQPAMAFASGPASAPLAPGHPWHVWMG